MTEIHRLVQRTSLNVFLLVVSFALAVLFAEVIVRFVSPQNLTGSWVVETSKGLFLNKSSGTAKHQFDKHIVNYKFYEPHLRDTPLTADGIRILILGDSYAFGWLLDKADTYAHRLQEYSDKKFKAGTFRFLNAATGGWGTADYVAFVEDYGQVIRPKIIVVFINTDDIGRSIKRDIYTMEDSHDARLVRNTMEPSSLRKLARSLPGYQWLLENSHLFQLARKIGYHVVNSPDVPKMIASEGNKGPNSTGLNTSPRKATLLGQALFRRLKEWCDAHDVLLLVTTTGWHKESVARSSSESTEEFMLGAQRFFRNIRTSFLDVSDAVARERKKGGVFTIQGDGHPNEAGSKLTIDNVWNLFLQGELTKYCRTTGRCS